MLWSESSESWRHYAVRRNSDFWLLDAKGNRIGDSPQPTDVRTVEDLLQNL